MIPPVAARLPDGNRLHLQHGPIDLIIEVTGPAPVVADAETAAIGRFETILDELVPQLTMLRSSVGSGEPQGTVATRMVEAATPFAEVFVTPMVAVAGSVADEVLAAIVRVPDVVRAYVNNGGDVAFHLTAGTSLNVGLVPSPTSGRPAHVLQVTPDLPVRGAATSGAGGRSFSFGIADGVTVLASRTALADAAASLIANAVDLPGHPAIERAPADELDPDSDLGDRPVTVAVHELSDTDIATALDRGVATAERWCQQVPELYGAVLGLRGHTRIVGVRDGAIADPSTTPTGAGEVLEEAHRAR